MLVIPAIDLKGGCCVRLVQGDMARETVYAEDPVAVARGFEQAGAEWIHVVDLDGAISGKPVNEDAIARVCRSVGARVEVGGGVRDLATLDRVLAPAPDGSSWGRGARGSRVFAAACRKHPGQIPAGIDARKGKVSVAGWTKDSTTDAAGPGEVHRAGAAASLHRHRPRRHRRRREYRCSRCHRRRGRRARDRIGRRRLAHDVRKPVRSVVATSSRDRRPGDLHRRGRPRDRAPVGRGQEA
jgi:hypothetical protein